MSVGVGYGYNQSSEDSVGSMGKTCMYTETIPRRVEACLMSAEVVAAFAAVRTWAAQVQLDSCGREAVTDMETV